MHKLPRSLLNAAKKVNHQNFSTLAETKVKDLLIKWENTFMAQHISKPKESIERILASVLNTSLSNISSQMNTSLHQDKVNTIEKLCQDRLKRVPLPYILKEWEFCDIKLKVKPPVFMPEIQTQLLVKYAGEEIKKKNITKCLELCCGSGAISLALLHKFPQLKVVAVDQSTNACALTKENSDLLNLSDRITIVNKQINMHTKEDLLDQKFDIMVSNPPYVKSDDISALAVEKLLYEDLRASHAGTEGLDMIKLVLHVARKLINKGGKIFLEVEPYHPPMVKTLLENDSDLKYIRSYEDQFIQQDRFVEIEKL